MTKLLRKILLLLVIAGFLLTAVPSAYAYEPGDPCRIDLRAFIRDREKREYVEMMLDHHVRTNRDIQNALEGGFTAVFLFDGCSDNMKDPELSDLSYYRVSGVCIVLQKHTSGDIRLVYFNDDASTIPDQPLKYGAWSLPQVGDVGPATVCDGTYQLYSVYHRGEYEALHVRTEYRDGTLDAIYMTPGGYAPYRANEINIHTRTSNHIAGYGMWSAGCPLVGDGKTWDFRRLIHSTYYTSYDRFEIDNFVGTLTIDRMQLRTEMYTLYKNPDAVDAIVKNSREQLPENYWEQCAEPVSYEEPELRITSRETALMDMPCSLQEDARVKLLAMIPEGEKLTVNGSIRNHLENKWLITSWNGTDGYLFSGDTKPESWKDRLLDLLTGE